MQTEQKEPKKIFDINSNLTDRLKWERLKEVQKSNPNTFLLLYVNAIIPTRGGRYKLGPVIPITGTIDILERISSKDKLSEEEISILTHRGNIYKVRYDNVHSAYILGDYQTG